MFRIEFTADDSKDVLQVLEGLIHAIEGLTKNYPRMQLIKTIKEKPEPVEDDENPFDRLMSHFKSGDFFTALKARKIMKRMRKDPNHVYHLLRKAIGLGLMKKHGDGKGAKYEVL
jgi:hypothetical protein